MSERKDRLPIPACVTQGNAKHMRWCGSSLARANGGTRKDWLHILRMRVASASLEALIETFHAPGFDFPEGFETWPMHVRRSWLEELHAIYFNFQ